MNPSYHTEFSGKEDSMDRLHAIVDKILKKVEIGKFITTGTALKIILKLVKLQSFVAKRCKMWKM